jgi:hypothetical protein
MAAGNTYDAIATQTLSSTAASVTFSSIPSTYTDLILVCNPITAVTTGQIAIRLNADTGTNYSRTILWGNGATAGSYRNANENYAYTGYYTNLWTNPTTVIFQINNYSNATTNKTILGRSSNANEASMASVNLWRSTSAITAIELTISGASSYSIGSTFSLYGIASA